MTDLMARLRSLNLSGSSSWAKRPQAFYPEDFRLRAPEELLPSDLALGADFWAGNVISLPDVVVSQLDFAWIRAGQGVRPDTGYKATSAIFKGQKPRGPYWVYDPRIFSDDHISAILNTIDADSELPLWIDVELTIAGKTAANYWDDLSHILGTLTSELGYKPVIYTGMWWWQPNMLRSGLGVAGYPDWQSEFKFALAEYPYSTDVVSCSWADLKAKWLPAVRIPRLACGITASQVADWQFSGDKFILPGVTNGLGLPTKLDLNYVYDLQRLLVKPVQPIKTLDQRVTTLEAQAIAHDWVLN